MSEFNKLKSVSVSDIEQAIAKVLTELTGIQYGCTISNVKYQVFEGAELDVSVSMKTNFSTQEKSE
jgi:hypothetical protein